MSKEMGNTAKKARHFFWLIPVVLGIVFIGAGIYMYSEGKAAKDDVRSAIVAEQITTSEDASIPGVLVNNAARAESQANVINMHVLERTEGLTYSQLGRFATPDGDPAGTSDETLAKLDANGNPVPNPLRATYLDAVALRTALNTAVMGFRVSDLVMGIGAFMGVIGATFILFLAPAVYWAAEVANERTAAEKKQTAATTTVTLTA